MHLRNNPVQCPLVCCHCTVTQQQFSYFSLQLPDVRAVRGSFKKFQRACCPSGAETDVGYISQVQESEWLQQVGEVGRGWRGGGG